MIIATRTQATSLVGTLLLLVLPRASTAQPTCASPSVTYPHEACLDMSAAADASPHHSLIEEEVDRTLRRIWTLLPVDNLKLAVITDADRTIPTLGIGGYTSGENDVQIYLDAHREDLGEVIKKELAFMLAHEVHHAMRMRTVRYGSTLLEASVSEGLADHFAEEVTGVPPPPWSTALSGAELTKWIPRVTAGVRGKYVHRDWFLGANPEIPVWTGYAVGYELVRRYLTDRPDVRASTLYAEPANSFIPGP